MIPAAQEKKNVFSRHLEKVVLLAVLVIAGAFGFLVYRHQILAQELRRSGERFVATTRTSGNVIDEFEANAYRAQEENVNLSDALQAEQAKMAAFEADIREITGRVWTLEKLKKLDPELLKKYSRVYFLNEHYVPSGLTIFDKTHWYSEDKPQQVHSSVAPFLDRLLRDALANNLELKLLSAYRSFGTQGAVKSGYTVTYGAGTANQFSADQGYSEHQLGTAVDFTTPEVGATLSNFKKSPAYEWLKQNAHRYGFTLSYPEKNKYYVFEPWHWRFVGISLATKLHDEDRFFYDLDQREIDTYLLTIFDG